MKIRISPSKARQRGEPKKPVAPVKEQILVFVASDLSNYKIVKKIVNQETGGF
jgi:hypothetical protein